MPLNSPLIAALPSPLVNGTPNDASQVMADFNQILNNTNNNLALVGSTSGANYIGITSDSRWGGGVSVQDALSTLIDKQQLSDTGSVNALAVTPAGSLFTANVTGMFFIVKPANTTTNTTPTLQIGTAPALTIVNTNGAAHVAGAIQANRLALFWIDTVNNKAVHLNPLTVSGSATVTLTGLTTTVTLTMSYWISQDGKGLDFSFPAANGTSNATSMSITGIPAAAQAATISSQIITFVLDSAAATWGNIGAFNTSIWTTNKNNVGTGNYTASSTKGIPAGGIQGHITLN